MLAGSTFNGVEIVHWEFEKFMFKRMASKNFQYWVMPLFMQMYDIYTLFYIPK